MDLVLAHNNKITEWLAMAEGAVSKHTIKAMRFDLAGWEKWANENDRQVFPAQAKDIADCVRARTGEYRSASLSRLCNSLTAVHRIAELPIPTHSQPVVMALKAAKNYDANNCIEQEQQDPITWQHVKAINESINGSINQYENGDLRDMALILVAYRTMFRAAELREIRVEHVNFEDMTVKIFKTKGKCETQIKPICESTAIAISRWMGAAGINEGPLFRSFYRGKRSVRPTAMGADVVSDVFKEKMALAGFDNKNISAHSTRIGAAQDLYTNGAHTGEIMKSGGWDSPAMVLRYCRNVSAHTGGMGDMLRAQSL